MNNLREKVKEFAIRFQRGHGELRWRERSIPPDEIEDIVRQWDVIDDTKDGRYLLWGELDNKRIIHIPCFLDMQTKIIWVLTVYYPDDENFTMESNYRVRKTISK